MIPRLEAARHRVTKPTKAGTPPHFHLDTLILIWQYEVARYFENETESRQIGVMFSLLRLGHAVYRRSLRTDAGVYRSRAPAHMHCRFPFHLGR